MSMLSFVFSSLLIDLTEIGAHTLCIIYSVQELRLKIRLNRILGILVFGLGIGTFATPESCWAQLGFTVNSLVDAPDDSLNDGICADEFGNCTLRAAIEQAQGNPVNITFSARVPLP